MPNGRSYEQTHTNKFKRPLKAYTGLGAANAPGRYLVRVWEADDEVVEVVASEVVEAVVAEELEEAEHSQAPVLDLLGLAVRKSLIIHVKEAAL